VTKYKDLLSLKRETKSPFYKFILHTIMRRLALVTSSPLLLNNIPQNIRVILFN